MSKAAPEEHERLLAWKNEGNVWPEEHENTPQHPCEFCGQGRTHKKTPVYDKETGRLFGFMCESPVPIPEEAWKTPNWHVHH